MAHITLCDDHQIIIEGQRRLLEALGHTVVAAVSNGRELVKLFQAGASIDLVIVDVSMPLLNGIDTVSEVMRLSPKTKCIIMSMYEEPARITHALAAGAKGYVSKQTDMREFENAVRMVLGGQSYISPHLCCEVLLHGGKRVLAERVLSAREREVLQLIAEGYSDKEIAQELGISIRTVRFHRDTVRREYQCDSTAALVKLALRHGLTDL